MPIYEYQCDGCNAVFEVFQKVSDPAPTTHACGSEKVHRILSNTSFVLKGTGWYATDYADKPKKTDDAAGGKAQKKTDTNASSGNSGEKGGGQTSANAAPKPNTSGTGGGKAGGSGGSTS
jgi:putative FmdB family regulatory protein